MFSPLWSCFVFVICNFFFECSCSRKSLKENIRNYAVKPLQKSTPIASKLRLKFCIISKRGLWAGGEGRMDTATQPWRRGRKLVLQMASVLTFYQQNGRLQVVSKQTSKSIFIQSFCCFSCSCCFCFVLLLSYLFVCFITMWLFPLWRLDSGDHWSCFVHRWGTYRNLSRTLPPGTDD